MKLEIYTDGGSRHNPGNAAIGILILKEKQKVLEYKEFIGKKTNNQAEYSALIKAYDLAENLGASEIDFFLDSELVVRQMKGEYKVRDANLLEMNETAKKKESKFKTTYTHVKREHPNIQIADRLVNEALDEHEKSC